MKNEDKNSSSAPANQAVEQTSNSLTGRCFAHFSPGTDGRAGQVRFGIVEAQLDADHWLLNFDAGTYSFANVLSLKQLEPVVFFLDRDAQQAFLADLTAQQIASRAPPASNAGRGSAGTMLEGIA